MKKVARRFLWVGLVTLVSGCGGVFQGAEQRINAAVPLTSEVAAAKKAADTLLVGDRDTVEKFTNDWNSKLKIRALSCAKGYSPGLLASAPQIRAALGDTKCFEEFDKEMKFWVNQKRVAAMLRLPPLRPIPKNSPRFIVGKNLVGGFTFAEGAGVALLSYGHALQIIDIGTSDIIFEENGTRDGSAGGSRPSANGRLFVGSSAEGPIVRDAETGENLLEYRGYSSFRWLDKGYALAERNATGYQLLLLDFESGEESPIRGMNAGGVMGVAAVPGKAERFVLSEQSALQMIELQRHNGRTEMRLVAEQQLEEPLFWADNTGDRSADGSFYVNGMRQLSITLLASLRNTTHSLEPFVPQSALPTPDNYQVIVTGFLKGVLNQSRGVYLLSLKDKTIALIDESTLRSGLITYIRPLNKMGIVRNGRVEVLDSVPHGPFVPLEEQTAAWKAAMVAQMQAQPPSIPGYPDPRTAMWMARSAPTKTVVPVDSPLVALAKDANVEAVGVYEATNSVHGVGIASKTGEINVSVRRSSKPLVLVLASYEPIHWKLNVQGGARLALVLLSSYNSSVITGTANVRTVVIGRSYAYERGSQEYMALDDAVFATVGRHIGIFQGTYKGQTFTVGGL